MKAYTSIFLIFCLIFAGCEVMKGSCITVEASKGDYSGGITYCFDKEKTAELKTPTLTGKTEEGETTDFFGISKDEIEKIIDKIKGTEEKPGVKGLKTPPKHPILKLKELLK